MKGHGRILREVERTLAGIPAVIRYKNIKNLYLSVRRGTLSSMRLPSAPTRR